MATSSAARLDGDVPAHDAESLSVSGSLLLRGASAAAEHDDRHTAHELLAEAEDAATRLGEDRNLRWTAFGPTNAKLHQVNIAVTLGDAGIAIDVARTVNLSNVTVTERRARFLVDTARAFLHCSKARQGIPRTVGSREDGTRGRLRAFRGPPPCPRPDHLGPAEH